MTNSHVAESLGTWATPERPRLRHALAELVRRFVHMMFHDGDLSRPNCYEHYNPLTGAASVYRGIDDYQHSWVADLLIRFVTGLRPHAEGIVVDPLPFGVEHAELAGARVRGRTISVTVTGDRFVLTVDADRYDAPLGEAIELAF